MLSIQMLTVRQGGITLLGDVSFTLDPGQWLMVAGPNGAGKSTLIRAISREIPSTGEMRYRGENLRAMRPAALAREVGVLPQGHQVSYAFSVEEVVNLGRYAHQSGRFSFSDEGGPAKVWEALELTGMLPIKDQSVLTLSGGELQRTFLAQVLAQDPNLLLLDEPTNHLDLAYQRQVFAWIGTWLKTPGRAVISVVHDVNLARAFGTHALLLDKGRQVAFGENKAVLSAKNLEAVYGMDVRGWMGELLSQWDA